MPSRKLRTYLRTRRLESGLSQVELAELADVHPDTISDYEREKYTIQAKLIIAGEIIFGLSAAELFPAFYKAVEDEICIRAAAMLERLEGKDDRRSAKKRKLLEGIPSRTKFMEL